MITSLHRDGFLRMPAGYALFNIIDSGDGLSSDYCLIEANDAFEQAVGFPVSRFEGKALSLFIRDASFPLELFDALRCAENAPAEKEIYISKTGQWFKASVYSPQPKYIVSLLFATSRKKVVSKPKDYTLPEALWAAPLPVFVANQAGVILDANRQSAAASGYEAQELVGMSLYRLIDRNSRVMGLMFYKELIQNGSSASQLQIKTKGGDAIWVNAHALKYGDNYIFYCQDISSYKALENELVTSELLYRTFINASSDLIYLKDEQLRYIIVNDALLRVQGFDYSDIIGRSHEEISPETSIDAMHESDLHVIRTKDSAVCEFSIGGGHFEAFKFPVSIGDGRTGVGAYIRSVTQKKRHEELQRRTLQRHRILSNALLMTFQSSQGLVEYALEEALKLTDSQCGILFTREDGTGAMTLRAQLCNAEHTDTSKKLYPVSQMMLWGQAVDSGRPVIENNYVPEGGLSGEAFGDVHNFMSIPILKNGKIVAAVCLVNKKGDFDEYDVTELSMLMNSVFVAAEKQNMQKNIENLFAQTQAMFNEHDAVMLLFDPETREIKEANPAAVAFYGYSKEELLTLKYDDILAPREANTFVLPEGDSKRFFSSPHQLKNGEIRIVDVYSCPINYHSDIMIFSIIFDVTEREKAFEEIKYLSFHDHLTGLYNRRYFDNIIKQMDDQRYYPLSIVISDVNGLKLINDSFGHAQGDELLVKAAELLQQGCRKNDICARIGGDEFAILLPNTNAAQAGKIVDRIKQMQSKVKIKQLDLSMSFGYAVKQDEKSDIELVFSEAENKMYRNKISESPSTRSKTIDIILKTLYGKSEEELRHAARVAKLSARVAAEMGLPMEQVMLVSEAGLLHDIGKVGIDKNVLNKRGQFTRAERLEIERHSESGWRILSNSDEYARLADVILYHHESPDGKGYPRGIKGDSIPLASRIIAVAEAFDAMTSHSSYRKAVSWNQAAEELRQKTGTQFDEQVVSVFVDKVLPRLSEEDLDLSAALSMIDRLNERRNA
ncbi:MAG TPA: diguanylate cyclase [Papillibacter sp.]|nr:diguanylate cyclase [Papillibacter sp.]